VTITLRYQSLQDNLTNILFKISTVYSITFEMRAVKITIFNCFACISAKHCYWVEFECNNFINSTTL